MNVLLLICSEGFFRAENMVMNLARNLRRLSCYCVMGVFCDPRYGHTEIAGHAGQERLTVELIPCRGRIDYHAIGRIRDVLVMHEIDILHTHGYKADLY